MDNMERIIKQHNNKVLSTPAARPNSGCNCRKKEQCPLSNNCLTPSLSTEHTSRLTPTQQESLTSDSRKDHSSNDTTTTRYPSETENAKTALNSPSTSGNSRTNMLATKYTGPYSQKPPPTTTRQSAATYA